MPPTAVASDVDFMLEPRPGLWREDNQLSRQGGMPSRPVNSGVSPHPFSERPLEVRDSTATKSCNGWFDELEQRHGTMMWNIQQLETRLDEISVQIKQ